MASGGQLAVEHGQRDTRCTIRCHGDPVVVQRENRPTAELESQGSSPCWGYRIYANETVCAETTVLLYEPSCSHLSGYFHTKLNIPSSRI